MWREVNVENAEELTQRGKMLVTHQKVSTCKGCGHYLQCTDYTAYHEHMAHVAAEFRTPTATPLARKDHPSVGGRILIQPKWSAVITSRVNHGRARVITSLKRSISSCWAASEKIDFVLSPFFGFLPWRLVRGGTRPVK